MPDKSGTRKRSSLETEALDNESFDTVEAAGNQPEVTKEEPLGSLARSEDRVAELEAELQAAKATIHALLEKAERRRLPERGGILSGLGSDSSQRDGDDDSSPGRDQLLTATSKLDRIVRQRTRALTESEAQLQRKNVELQRLNEMKAEFISIATHELRTPLTSIVGYLDLVVEGRFGKLPESMTRPIASLRRNAHRLKHLVDEMLDVSRIDSGRITLFRRPCELAEIVELAANGLQSIMETKNLQLAVHIEARPRINADADKVRRAITKLIANAVRHTPEGGKIVVTVDTTPVDPLLATWARLRVKGDGEGIPLHLRSRIFEPFSDVHTAKHHTSTGPDSAGLGLYIARGLIDLHGGSISVDSEEGTFTEFTVLLPMA